MFLFLKKKREENLRALTEKEIQEKLYGHFKARASKDVTLASTVEDDGVGELFTPPLDHKHPKEAASFQKVSQKSGKPASFFKSLGQRWEDRFSETRLLPNLSMPKIPRMKKPRWVEKMEGVPLSRVSVFFFALVLIVVSFRALAQVIFNISPGIKAFQMRNVEKPVTTSATVEQNPSRSSTPEVSSVPKASAPTAPKKFYTIQMIIYEDTLPAQNLVSRLKKKNLDAFFKSIKTSRGKERFQVFLGHFTTYDQAQAQLARYRKSNLLAEFKDSFVRPQVE